MPTGGDRQPCHAKLCFLLFYSGTAKALALTFAGEGAQEADDVATAALRDAHAGKAYAMMLAASSIVSMLRDEIPLMDQL